MKSKGWMQAACRALAMGSRFTSRLPSCISSLALAATQSVTSVSAGPPLGGLYLMPPLSGGLWEGVMTMPSARSSVRPWFQVRMAREMEGVGVKAPSLATMVSTPLRGQHLEGRDLGRFRQGMGVLAQVERAGDARQLPVEADGLDDGQDVVLVEGAVAGGAPVARSAEAHGAASFGGIGFAPCSRHSRGPGCRAGWTWVRACQREGACNPPWKCFVDQDHRLGRQTFAHGR